MTDHINVKRNGRPPDCDHLAKTRVTDDLAQCPAASLVVITPCPVGEYVPCSCQYGDALISIYRLFPIILLTSYECDRDRTAVYILLKGVPAHVAGLWATHIWEQLAVDPGVSPAIMFGFGVVSTTAETAACAVSLALHAANTSIEQGGRPVVCCTRHPI